MMLCLIIESTVTFILVVVVAFFVSRHIHQTRARADAQRIIEGKQAANAEQLSKIINALQSTDYLGLQITDGDFQRVRQLRDIQDEMLKPHP